MKTLIIDCQLFQTPTLHRGMGRYTLGILYALQKHQPDFVTEYKFVGLYNDQYVDNDRWQSVLRQFFPEISFKGLTLHSIADEGTGDALAANRRTLGAHIDTAYPEDEVCYFVPAMLDDTIYACFPAAKKDMTKIVLFHDLIPYLFWERYLGSARKKRAYFYRLKDLFIADIVLCNSETTANDLARFLFIPHDRLHVLRSGNTNELGLQESVGYDNELRTKLADQKFILSVSGDDERKNNIRMATAFDQFNRLHNDEYALVVTSSFSEGTKRKLQAQTKRIMFTGNVSVADLEWLYQHAAAVLFVPEYEGLGLPILEAAKYTTRLVVSDIEVFRELTAAGVYFADYTDPHAIATALHDVVSSSWKSQAGAITDMFSAWSWTVVAERFVTALSGSAKRQVTARKHKIAIVAPDPVGISAIGRFIQSHHATMMQFAEVTYYLEKSPNVTEEKIGFLPYVADCRNITEYTKDLRTTTYDSVVYHIGNSDYHLATLQYALRFPGTVVVHDTDLSGLARISCDFGLWDNVRYAAEAKLNELLAARGSKLRFFGSAVHASKKVLTHSDYAQEAVRAAVVDKPVAKKQLPMLGPLSYKRYSKDSYLHVGVAGILNSAKGTDVLKMALAHPKSSEGVLYHLFGYSFAADQIELLRMYELGPIVLELDMNDFAFQNRLREMDALLNYRPQYHGESSSATLEAMRYGVVPIVRNIGWFSKLPDEAAFKVNAVDMVPEAITRLAADRDMLADMSRRAYEYVQDTCSVEAYVKECIGE